MKITGLVVFSAVAMLGTTFPSNDGEIIYDPDEGIVLTRTHEVEFESEGTMTVVFGPGTDADDQVTTELAMSGEERYVFIDKLDSIGDGRPRALTREYKELWLELELEVGGGLERSRREMGSPLEGESVRIEWDGEKERYTFTPVGESELEDWHLADLEEDLDYRRFLPPGEVTKGDSWELEDGVIIPLVWPGGALGMRGSSAEDDPSIAKGERRDMQAQEVEGEATYLGQREIDGQYLAVIAVELASTAEIEYEDDGYVADVAHRVVEVDQDRKITGELLWDCEHGHLHSARFESESSHRIAEHATLETEGPETERRIIRQTTSEAQLTFTVERE